MNQASVASSATPLGHAPILDRLAQRGLVIGGVGLAAGLASIWFGEGGLQRFMGSYVLAFAFVLSIALGALGFVIIFHVTRAGWSVTNRRMCELLTATFPMLAILFLPIALNLLLAAHPVHPWADHTFAEHDPLILKKASYLNTSFFLVRWAIYFAVWIGLARFFFSNSLQQDQTGDPLLTIKMEKWAAPSVLLFGLSLSFAAFDLLMSLDPHWFSTIFGVIYFAGSMMTIFSFLVPLGMWLQARGAIGAGEITVEHRHDLGKFMFGFVIFWSYTSFSQFMLIWYANNPEETGWFDIRQRGAMGYFAIALIFVHFVIPFLGLLSRHVKRHKGGLLFWAIWLLFAQWLDLFFITVPSVKQFLALRQDGAVHGEGAAHGEAGAGALDAVHADAGHAAAGNEVLHLDFPLELSDLLVPLGLIGFLLFFFARAARSVALTPRLDPRRQESLSLQNI